CRGRNRSTPESFRATFQGVLEKAHIRRIGHDADNIIHCRTLQIEELFDFHVGVSALFHEIALMNNLSIIFALWANPSEKDEFTRICNSYHFRELAFRPFIVIEISLLEAR